MQFYPQRVFGVEWNNEFVNKLVEWDEEEYGEFDPDCDHGDTLVELLSEEYGIEAHIKSFEWVRGGYVQGLSGLDWGTTYLIVDEFQSFNFFDFLHDDFSLARYPLFCMIFGGFWHSSPAAGDLI